MSAALIVQLVMVVLAGLPELIKAVEALRAGQTGAGPEKKKFVLDLIGKALSVAQAADPKVSRIITPAVIAKIQEVAAGSVDEAVTVMNTAADEKPAA